MKKIFVLILILFSFTSYGKLMNHIGSKSKSIWDSIPEPTCKNDGFYNGVTIMLVIGADAPGLDEFPKNGPYWYQKTNFKQPYIYYLDDFKKMVKRGADLYFFVSPDVSKSLILQTLPLADMIVYIGHGGFKNNIPTIFSMEITIDQFKKENPNVKDISSSDGYMQYNVVPSDLNNIKLKSNCIVLMFSVCYSSGESASDPSNGITYNDALLRTQSYSNMFLSRGAKCYFAYNNIKTMFPLFESGLSIKDIRVKMIGTDQYDKLKDGYVIMNNNKSYGFCLVGDFNYNINTLCGK